MNDEIERWAQEQEALPDHLQRWVIFERPNRIRLASILIRIGFSQWGRKLCGMRFENDEERNERLRQYWEQNESRTPD